jgi:hypothetical protein
MSDGAMMDRIVLAFAAESDLDYRIGFKEFIYGLYVPGVASVARSPTYSQSFPSIPPVPCESIDSHRYVALSVGRYFCGDASRSKSIFASRCTTA